MIKRLLVGYWMLGLPVWCFGQKPIGTDTALTRLARQVIAQMYNWEFEACERSLMLLEQQVPGHPAIAFAKGMILYWKHYPTADNTPELQQQFYWFNLASHQADVALKTNHSAPAEIKYIRMTARGMIMKYHAEFGHFMTALSEARSLYNALLEGMKLQYQFTDYYLTSGIYNYYREYYPEIFPVYRPFMSFFKKGDRKLGLAQVEYAARAGIFSQPEALSFLAHLYLRFEKNVPKGTTLYRELCEKYPKNLFFQISVGEAAMLSKDWNLVQKIATLVFEKCKHPFYVGYAHIFQALVEEHVRHNHLKAWEHFKEAEKLMPQMGKPLYQHDTFIYAGLYRFHTRKNHRELAQQYLKKAKQSDITGYLEAFGLLEIKQ